MWLKFGIIPQLMPRECINSLFDNFTWTKIWGSSLPPGLGRSAVWFHPDVSIFVILILFFTMKVGTFQSLLHFVLHQSSVIYNIFTVLRSFNYVGFFHVSLSSIECHSKL